MDVLRFVRQIREIAQQINDHRDDDEKENIPINYNEMISSKGFSSSFELPEGNIYELRIKNARYHNRDVATNIYKKFTLAN